MSYQLTDFQQDAKGAVYKAYRDGARNVMCVMPTGAGKTVLMGACAHEYDGFGCSIAHRGELVGQMSLALAREGLRHDIIAPDSLIRTIVGGHMEEIGRSYYDARAKWKVASVDTIIRRDLPKTWTRQVGMVHTDEGHHVLRDNKWGRAMQIFDNAYGLLVTATPERADGRGLGSHADGIVDALVEGPGMRWLIDNGYLTDYHVLAPMPDDLHMEDVEISKTTGDYNVDKMRKRVKASNKIVGDVVKTYLQFARGMKGITFAVDIEHATQISAAFNAAGVASCIVQAETPESERREIMRRFRKGDLMQLVNVDLFGEGVDVPAVQVVSMARPTASYSLYAQQFGRALRLLVSPILRAAWHTYSATERKQYIAESEKPRAMVIDHVGNIIKHQGPPDWRTTPWSLDSRDRRKSADDAIPLRACGNPECNEPFLRIYPSCPHCGWTPPEPSDRSRPEFVDGDIVMYTQELLQQLFGAKKAIDSNFVPVPAGATPNSPIAQRLRNLHAANQASQKLLRDAMSLVLPPIMDERVANRRFFHTFGVDTLSAQGLTSADADKLRQRILAKVTGQ
jgi:superfamily II DNA or RNA helicase